MTMVDFFKQAVGAVASVGVSTIVGKAIRNNVKANGIFETITIFAGSLVIGGMVADASKTYVCNKIDELRENWSQISA